MVYACVRASACNQPITTFIDVAWLLACVKTKADQTVSHSLSVAVVRGSWAVAPTSLRPSAAAGPGLQRFLRSHPHPLFSPLPILLLRPLTSGCQSGEHNVIQQNVVKLITRRMCERSTVSCTTLPSTTNHVNQSQSIASP